MEHHRERARGASSRSDRWTAGAGVLPSDRLTAVVDAAIAATIFFVPFLMGGRQALGQFALVLLAVVAGLAWAVRAILKPSTWRPTWALAIFALGAGLPVLQIVPLPPGLHQRLSPETSHLLPLWQPGGVVELGAWQCLSLTPAETVAGLVVFLAYAVLFFVVVQRIDGMGDVERLLRWCAAAAAAMAAFGLAQFFWSNGKFFWFYEHPNSDTYSRVKGAFTCRNHFAQFLALGIGPLVWWMQHQQYRRTKRKEKGQLTEKSLRKFRVRLVLAALAAALTVLACLMSLSRGGNIAMLVAAAVVTGVCYRASAVGGRWVALVAGGGLLIVGLLTVSTVGDVESRLNTLLCGSLDEVDQNGGRRNIWTANLRGFRLFAPLGTGVGSHCEVYETYFDAPLDTNSEFTHAENSYLQVALESGVAGLTLAAAAIVLCASWCLGGLRRAKSNRAFIALGAIAAGLLANAVHAAVDFTWYVPGCMVVVVVLAAAALRARQLAGDRAAAGRHSLPLPRRAAWVAAVATILFGGWMIGNRFGPVVAEPAWQGHLIAGRAAKLDLPGAEDRDEESVRKAKWARINILRQRVEDLEHVVRWQPNHLRAHFELANARLRLFDAIQAVSENRMSLVDIREAVQRSKFGSRPAIEAWLAKAVGGHWIHLAEALEHARLGLALSPLHGEGYLLLADLCFLEAANPTVQAAYVEQALRARPYDGDVLLVVAKQALRAGDVPAWLDHAHRSFSAGKQHQQRILSELVAGAPAEGVGAMIDFLMREFQPQREAVRAMYVAALQFEAPERFTLYPPEEQPVAFQAIRVQLAPLRLYYAQACEAEAQTAEGGDAVNLLLDAQRCYSELADTAKAVACLRRALRIDANHYEVHYQLAARLIDQQEFAEAQTHLQWCLYRKPDEQRLERRFKEALRGKMDQEAGIMADRVPPTRWY